MLNTCGQFVEAVSILLEVAVGRQLTQDQMADFLGAEFRINTVICPAPIRRDLDDSQTGDMPASQLDRRS